MIARNIISDEIPPLKTTDTGLKGLQWMEEFKIAHLPIVSKGEYIGLLSDSEILDLADPGKTLGEHRLTLMRPYVFGQNHIYEVIKLVNNLSISVVPVLDEDNMYMGSITLGKLVQSFAGLAAANDPGGIIALELNSNDYSLTQIANIVEGNDARILSMYVASTADSTKMAVIIKVNRTDLSGILQTFNRYDYLVTASFYDNEAIDDVRQRYDSFMNYLNI